MSGNNQSGDAEFDEFVASGSVEVGDSNLASQAGEETPKKEEKPAKPAARRGPPKPAPTPEPAAKPAGKEDDGDGDDDDDDDEAGKPGDGDDDDEGGEGDDAGDDGDEGDDDEKPKKASRKPSDRIRDLTRRLRETERQKDALTTALASRLDALEKGGLPSNGGGGTPPTEEIPAPDPTDTEKYPLGHLDDRYIEDKLEWLTERKAAERADAVLHRQQENENAEAAKRTQQAILGMVDDLAARGADIEDFQEIVIDTGLKGEWDLSQATFEAAHEAEHGAEILYELSQDKKEASRVAKLSNYQQMKFVQERDAEIAKTKTPRKIPKAGEPPKHTARGANSRVQIDPATDNLDDFEKLYEKEAKRTG